MSEDRQLDVLIAQADLRMQMRDWRGAIDAVRGALAIDPDHARCHALLALALLGAKRLAAAELEARTALHLDSGSPYCHYAVASVACARRKLDDAWAHCQIALQADSHDCDIHVLAAWICELRGDPDDARGLLREALELEPDHVGALTRLAHVELRAHRLDEAARHADQALRARPDDVDAHVVAGMIALVRGELGDAESHARFALNQEAGDDGALYLWAAIKARRSWTLGLWWRFNAFVSLRSTAGQVSLLIGSFVIAQLAIIIAGALDAVVLERLLELAWLGFCAYTWAAPSLFRRLLARDLGRVALDPEY